MAKPNRTKEFIEALKGEQSGGPAPSDNAMKRFFSEIGTELKRQGEMGATELAKAVLSGHDGFVLYGRDGNDDAEKTPLHGPTIEPQKQPEAEQDRGREM